MSYPDLNLTSGFKYFMERSNVSEAKVSDFLAFLAEVDYLSSFGLAYFLAQINTRPLSEKLLEKDPREQSPLAQALLRFFSEGTQQNSDLEGLIRVFVGSGLIPEEEEPHLITLINENKTKVKERKLKSS